MGLVHDKGRGPKKSETSHGNPAFTPKLEGPATNENPICKKINPMKKLIFLISSIAIASSAIGQDERPNRERPDFFALADKNEDGGVSFKELVDARIAAMQRRAGGQQREGGPDPEQIKKRIETAMKDAFKKADADENGSLSEEEFNAMPQRGGPGGRGGRGGPGGGRGGPGGGGPRVGGNA